MKVLLLNSGGLDSAMLAYKLHSDGHEVTSLFLDIGALQTPSAMIAAQETADRYCVKHIVHQDITKEGHTDHLWSPDDATFIWYDDATPEQQAQLGHPESQFIHGVAPSYTLRVITAGVIFAQQENIPVTMTGSKMEVLDQTYADALNRVSVGSRYPKWQPLLELPLIEVQGYTGVAEYAGVTDITDFSYTHSCRMAEPCGVCGKCSQREGLGI